MVSRNIIISKRTSTLCGCITEIDYLVCASFFSWHQVCFIACFQMFSVLWINKFVMENGLLEK